MPDKTTETPLSLLPLIIAGVGSTGLYLYMAVTSRGYADATLIDVAMVYGGCWVLLGVAFVRLSYPTDSGLTAVSDTPLGFAVRQPMVLWVVLFAVLFRLIGVFTFPVLEDDYFRYLWDGRALIETGQPYSVAPAEWFGDDRGPLNERFADILDGINYPGVATVYGPTLQLVFGLGYLVAPGAVWPLQLFAASADIAIVLLLLSLLDKTSRAQWVCWVLYAWSPLLIKEFATTAHPDVFGVLLLVVCLLATRAKRWCLAGVLLAVATGVKPFALVIGPFLFAAGLKPTALWRALAGFVLAIAALSGLFVGLAGGAQSMEVTDVVQTVVQVWLPDGLRAMGQGWLFNAGVYEFARWSLGIEPTLLRQVLLVGAAAIWGALLWRVVRFRTQSSEQQRLLALVSLVLLLILPALNPWYLIWALPFAVLYPLVCTWVASAAVLLSYGSGINLSDPNLGLYDLPGWLLALEFGAIALAGGYDLWRNRRQRS